LVGSSNLDVGQGSEAYRDAVISQASSGPLAGKIRVILDASFRQMAEIYASHDVCVLPSVNEPLGSAPLESMAFGCVPVISTGCGSAGYIDGKDCGLLVDADDLASLSDVLKTLIANPSLVAQMGKKAKSLVESEFDDAHFVERIESLVPKQ
jgi:glycosyltransferase involved in cell wall biosynthesis